MTELKDIENAVTSLLNNFEHGLAFTTNCRNLLEKLDDYQAKSRINVLLHQDAPMVSQGWTPPEVDLQDAIKYGEILDAEKKKVLK